MEEEYKEYYAEYYKNEYDANKNMAFALLFAAVLLTLIWIAYITGIILLTKETRLVVDITFPIDIIILVSPMFYLKSKFLKKPRFKNFLLYSLLFVISILNIIIPKHAILGWAVCIVLANHYYNPKLGTKIYIMILVLMLISVYAAMFLGEFDSNLLTGQSDEAQGLIYNAYFTEAFPDTPAGRYQYLHALKEIGQNRYITTFAYYYLARVVVISIVFFASNSLNKRTGNLLLSELRVSSEQSKTKTELEVATEIQKQTLPTEFITNKDVEIQAELKAAKEVGGDFYDYFRLDDTHIAILIGDVSGKGIGAAMFMMKAITCFKNIASINLTPKETLEKVNEKLIVGNDSEMFVTCLYAIINTENGKMVYANAGHTKPVVGKNKNFHFLNCNSGFLLGVMEDIFVIDEEYQLSHGELVTLYTDGITEARRSDGAFYGEERMLDLYNKKNYSCLLELHAELKDDIMTFVDNAPQSDDITYITLKYHGDEYVYEEKSYLGIQENIPKMLEFINSFASKYNFEKQFVNNLMVVGDEMISNIVRYGYKEIEGNVYIRLLYNIDNKEFVLTLIDIAPEFNPFKIEEKEIDSPSAKEGGLGILIVKKLMSEYAYDRINGKNIINLKKKFIEE